MKKNVILYFYGIFDLFQRGCSEKIFLGCDKSKSEIFESSIEAEIKSFSFLFGIYFDVQNQNIINVALAHLILAGLVILDLYNQKLADYYSNLIENLTSEIQKLVNENNVLQKYSDVADLNILIQIGLSIAGIDLTSNKNVGGRVSLMDKFYEPSKETISLPSNIGNNFNENEIKNNDEDEPLKVDEPKQNMMECFDLNLKAPENDFLNHGKIQKFIDMIKKSNENEQQLSLSNSKDRIIRFIKRFMEELIIFVLLCLALSKSNIYTSIYMWFK